MALRISEIVLDSHDPERLATFWCHVLDWSVTDRYDGQVEIGPDETGAGPTMVFVPSPDEKVQKLRLHLDLRPQGDDFGSEVSRLLAIGARRADVGQGDVPWEVFLDPEDNEFCLLGPAGTDA